MTDTQMIERETREQRGVFVRVTDDNGDLVDVRTSPVEVAFSPIAARPDPDEWHTASWDPDGPFEATELGGQAWKVLFEVGGPDSGADIELAPGNHRQYVRINTGDELPVMFVGYLQVN